LPEHAIDLCILTAALTSDGIVYEHANKCKKRYIKPCADLEAQQQPVRDTPHLINRCLEVVPLLVILGCMNRLFIIDPAYR